jgi:hypothetical protein
MAETTKDVVKEEKLSEESQRIKDYFENLLLQGLAIDNSAGGMATEGISQLPNVPSVSPQARTFSKTAQTTGGKFSLALSDFMKGVGIGQAKRGNNLELIKAYKDLMKNPEKETVTKEVKEVEETPEEIKVKAQKASKGVTDEYIKLYSSFDSSHPIIKKVDEALNQFEQMKGLLSNPSGPNDMATIYTFMKALDPTSVVRETEFKGAAKAAGAWETLNALGPKIVSGKFLSDEARQQFMDSALIIANTWLGARNKLRTKFSEHTAGNNDYVIRKFGQTPEPYFEKVTLPGTKAKETGKKVDYASEIEQVKAEVK